MPLIGIAIYTDHRLCFDFRALAVNLYRNVWPLAMYTGVPADVGEGPLLWVKISLLVITAAFVPLFSPRKYEPVNAEEPALEVNPEQTTPLISLLFWTFLNPLLIMAARLPHLGHDNLFPLADYDYSRNTTKRAFPVNIHFLEADQLLTCMQHLDIFQGAKKRHLFFGLMRTYRYEYSILAFTVLVQVTANFASPIGINMILQYMETDGRNATVKPWFWILWLFFGPMTISLARQWYIFVATRMLVHTEGLLTQLIFEHSLRIRMKAEGSDKPHDPESASANLRHENRRVKADNLVGKINNLVTTDMVNVVEARDFLFFMLYHPMQIILCIIFLYQFFCRACHDIDVSAYSGNDGQTDTDSASRKNENGEIFDSPVQHLLIPSRQTDSRVQTVTESCNVLRMLKLFGWESEMRQRIATRREEEVKWLMKRKMCDLVITIINFLIPAFTMLATYASHTLIFKKQLSASSVFSSMAVFVLLRRSLNSSFQGLSLLVEGKVSLDRLTDFIQNTELLDFVKATSETTLEVENRHPPDAIGFCDATFVWSQDRVSDAQAFVLRVDGELQFKQGCINLIIGPTGSGKTSLIMALLGEMHFLPTQPNSWYGLPREYGVAYAAQESWVQNDTIRGNILFGASYEEERYKAVLHQCGLERDLELFETGDMTEVGEKGLSLSGGQKARITLARAVYSQAQILLLDDILAALDVHTSAWIVEKCLRGDLVKGRTVILVTHNIALTSDLAAFIVSLGSNGTVLSQGTDMSIAIARNSKLILELRTNEETHAIEEQVVDGNKPEDPAPNDGLSKGKLIVAEEIQQGHVTWKSMKLFLSALGGAHLILFFCALIFGLFLIDLGVMFQTYLLGYWGSQYGEGDPNKINPFFYLGVYCLCLTAMIAIHTLVNLFYIHGTVRASIAIHMQLINAILGTTFRWLDETPTSRIITRCAKMADYYLKAQLSVKREMSNAKAPVLAHFGAAIAGLSGLL
ncbi:hypothetical protein NP233_g12480 [Leucocoprinus birnbaumii]|uniref:P-loop containing nucleoside triphosphate hydrolase protein n=1 Tax=Leucocoprinus birnbaumii TaxID=56174 RepID=A0AAD5VFL6_9AGAR|nr:hypothetical protein NP233_g12480 [Leucocoprinus birnbaumii]